MDNILQNTEPRIYQQVIFSECVSSSVNTLVVLPTGLGKTVIMAYLSAYVLNKSPTKQVLILTPTRPLVHQIKVMFSEFIGNITADMILEVSGEISPEKREKLYPSAKIIVGTPQTIENDLLYGRFNVENIGIACIDEVHRATGDYAYVGIAKQLKCQIIGFTATPGNNTEKILEVCENIQVAKISVTGPTDYDVADFISIHTPKVVWIELPELYNTILATLQEFQDNLLTTLKERISTITKSKYIGKREALSIHQQVVSLTKQDSSFGDLLISSSNLIRVQHLKELVESQGFPQVLSTVQKWKKKRSSKALRLFLEEPVIQKLEKSIQTEMLIHPKLKHLVFELKKELDDPDSRVIIFSNFRDTVRFLQEELTKFEIETGVFIGHSSSKSDKGLSQKEQIKVLDQFKSGEIKVLLSTSVGEEGLDVGNCDLVVFYDSVPSIVRAIQRQGRVTKGTRDEGMYWAIRHKDKKMKIFLKNELPELLVKKKKDEQHPTLDGFFIPPKNQAKKVNQKFKPSIIIDSRESSSRLPKLLKELGADIQSKKLHVGDYIVSDRLIIEYKQYSDFIRSILDGRLFQSSSPDQESQLVRLANQPSPLLIIEYDSNADNTQIQLNSLMGAISSILLDFQIPLVITQGENESASLIFQLAKREQEKGFSNHLIPSYTKKEQRIETIQLFMLAAIPGINLTKAKNLLNTFESIAKIIDADIDDLTSVPSIGPKLAKRIHMTLHQSGNVTIE
ncbi:MAG: DEAD/DEAH box helicase family protein [Promethearchaeota archaeon]|jgi:Fanconi anemia group M protein